MPKLLDLFCCEGGAARGYMQAGFEVTGVDLHSRFKKYYPGEYVVADAFDYLRENWRNFDAIHMSPPCQAFSVATIGLDQSKYPRLIAACRVEAMATDKPYIIENVVGAISQMIDPIMLCGSMFDLTAVDDDGTLLRLERHRLFESNIKITPPKMCYHDTSIPVGGVYGGGRSDRAEAKHVRRGGYTPLKHVRAALMGVQENEMSMRGLSQALPPAFTNHLGNQLLSVI